MVVIEQNALNYILIFSILLSKTEFNVLKIHLKFMMKNKDIKKVMLFCNYFPFD